MKKTFVFLLAACLLLVSAACSNTTPAKNEEAAPSGTETQGQAKEPESNASKSLVVYTAAAQDVMNIVIPEFEAQTGIKVEIVSAGTGELIKRIEAEKAKPLGDIEWGGTVAIISPKQELFEPYLSPNESAIIDSAKNAEGMMTRNNIIPMVLLVNKNLIGDIRIESYADLLNPKLKGKIAMNDPSKSATGLAHVQNMLSTFGVEDVNKGWDFVKDLVGNLDGKLVASSSAVPKGVADGEYAVGLTHEELASAVIRDGYPVEVVYMKEGVIISPGTVQIIKGAKNMENAKKFVDFLVSKELQTLTATKLNMRATRSDVPAPDGLKDISEIKIVNLSEASSDNQAVLDKFRDTFTSN